MRIQRRKRRSSWPIIGCVVLLSGCAGAALIGLLLLLPNLPALMLQIAGFQPRGDTEAVFGGISPVPALEVRDAGALTEAVLNLGSYGSERLNANRYPFSLLVGRSADGAPVATLTFTETSLMALCAQRTTVCSQTGSAYRNGRIDLRTGGAIVYADVFIPQLGAWQNAGIVMRLDSTNRKLNVRGVDLNGILYEAPPAALGSIVNDIEQTGNDILRQMILEAGGMRYTLAAIRIDDSALTLIMR